MMIGSVLYLSTMYTHVVALDAETGTELYVFDPRAYEGDRIKTLNSQGSLVSVDADDEGRA